MTSFLIYLFSIKEPASHVTCHFHSNRWTINMPKVLTTSCQLCSTNFKPTGLFWTKVHQIKFQHRRTNRFICPKCFDEHEFPKTWKVEEVFTNVRLMSSPPFSAILPTKKVPAKTTEDYIKEIKLMIADLDWFEYLTSITDTNVIAIWTCIKKELNYTKEVQNKLNFFIQSTLF